MIRPQYIPRLPPELTRCWLALVSRICRLKAPAQRLFTSGSVLRRVGIFFSSISKSPQEVKFSQKVCLGGWGVSPNIKILSFLHFLKIFERKIQADCGGGAHSLFPKATPLSLAQSYIHLHLTINESANCIVGP